MDVTPFRVTYRFGRFTLDLDRGALFLDEERIELRPKSFGMLRFFIENPGRLLDRDTIMEAIWPGTAIAEEGVVQCVRDIRRALGDEAQSVLKTVPKRGYIFTAAVSASGVGSQVPRDMWNGRPVVALIPFSAVTPSETYLASGLTDELVTALARIRSLSVICPRATHQPRPSQGIDGAGPTGFGVEYTLEGRVRRAGRRVRIYARLMCPATQTVLWADRYDGDVAEAFGIQDIATESITVAVEAYVIADEIDRAMRKDVSKLDAHGLFFRALRLIWQQTMSSTSEAVALLRRTIALDPGYAPALGMLSMCLQQQMVQGWRPYQPNTVNEALALNRQALDADRSDPLVLGVAGFVQTWLVGDHEWGTELSAKATVAGKHSAMILAMTGAVSSIGGDSVTAISRLETALRVDPVSPVATRLYTHVAGAHLFAGRLDQAALWAKRGLLAGPGYTVSQMYLIVALALQGDMTGARRAIAHMRTRQRAELPHWPGRVPFRYPWMQEMLEDGLRRVNLVLE